MWPPNLLELKIHVGFAQTAAAMGGFASNDAKISSKGQSMEPDCDVEKLKIQSSYKSNWSYKSAAIVKGVDTTFRTKAASTTNEN